MSSVLLAADPAPASAVERLQQGAAAADAPLELYSAWNAQVQAQPEPFQGALAVLDGGVGASVGDAGEHGAATSPWIYLAGGVLLGALGMFIAWRIRVSRASEGAPARSVQNIRAGERNIELISSQVLTDQGSVLVVDVCGERLVLGVSGKRDYVTLLTKVGDGASAPAMDPAAIQAMLQSAAIPGRPAAERSVVPERGPGAVERAAYLPERSAPRVERTAASAQDDTAFGDPSSLPEAASFERTPTFSSTSSAPATDAPQDEELEVLLDELLGKVRGLKPLAKRADDT